MKKRVEKKVNQCIMQKKSIGLNDFQLIIQLEWDNLDKSILSNLCTGIKNYLEAVIERGG